MPDKKVETTLADLAVNLVFDRTPGLADHYLGFEIIPGSQNEEKTRAAGLLGFRVGTEELYIPILFLNGKVKGSEVIYLSEADVFTSNSKQWIDYLTTKDTGTMGAGATPKTPLQQPSSQGLAVFSRNPGNIGKMAVLVEDADLDLPSAEAFQKALGRANAAGMTPSPETFKAIQSEYDTKKKQRDGKAKTAAFFEGAASDFWSKVASPEGDWTDISLGENFTLPNVLRSLGKEAYLKFASMLEQNPEVLSKVAQYFDVEKDIFFDWPQEKTASLEDPEMEAFFKSAQAAADECKLLMIMPEEIEEFSKQALDHSVQENLNRLIANGPDYLDAATTSPIILAGADVGRNFSKTDLAKIIAQRELPQLFGNGMKDEAVHRMVPVLGGRLAGLSGSPLAGAYLAKRAAVDSLTPEQKEQCFTDGYLVLDKRAEKEKTLVLKEDYRNRFSSPSESGFYEVLCSSGDIEKVFLAHQSFTIEHPHKRLSGDLLLDPESGVFTLPVIGEQVFVRSKLSTDEAVWKEKAGKMPSVSSMEPNKSYMLISSKMDTSIPFRVKGKTKTDSGLSFTCETSWDLRYRCMSPSESLYPGSCSSGMTGVTTVKVVDREDESSVAQVGDITYVPSSWKVIEVYDNSTSLQYGHSTYPTDNEAEKKERKEREEMAKVYFRILPGNSKTLTSVLANKNIHELSVHKTASDYSVRLDKEVVCHGNKVAALQTLVSGMGIGLDDAIAIIDESVSPTGTKQWVKEAYGPEVKAKDILPMEGFLPGAQDFLNTYSSNRAGRAVAMGHAAGKSDEEISSRLRYPIFSSLGDTLGGAALGGLAGAAIGGGASVLAGPQNPYSIDQGATIGGLGGVGVGALLGSIHNFIQRRKEMREISKEFDDTSPGDRNKTKSPEDPRISDYNPYIGPYNKGERDAYRFINGEQKEKPSFGGAGHTQVLSGLADAVVPGAGVPIFAAAGIAQGIGSSGKKEEAKKASESPSDAFERILNKSARGPSLNGEGLLYGGMAFPDNDQEIGQTSQGVTQLGPRAQREQVPINSMRDDTQDWRNMDEANWDKIQQRDMDFLMRAADSGSKPVFESSIINLLLKTNRTSDQVSEWLPDLVSSLDSKCRLLLLFYWHSSDFAENYGKDEMAEFEDVLLNSIKVDGQLILFLKQKASESSSSKIDAFAG
jgi:hypothetical protein